MTYLLEAVQARAGDFIGLRQDTHRHPELAYEEHRTAALVADNLHGWGYTVERGIGGTGVVGTLVRGSGTRRLGLRAEMDALPIDKARRASSANVSSGVMHACGDDGHSATLLAAARDLAEHASFDGTLHLVFQPADEGGGAALRMIADGLFERFPCDAIFAMRNVPGIEQGRLVLRDGAAMASSDYATITLTSVGGQRPLLHRGADPIVAAASIVVGLQTVVSRDVEPTYTAVVTVCALNARKGTDVMPASATLELGLRGLARELRPLLERRIRALVASQAKSLGVKAQIEWKQVYAVLVNSPAETAFAREVATELVGAERVTLQGAPLTGSDDFACMLEHVPGSYVLIGNGPGSGPRQGGCMVHDSGCDFKDGNVAIGSAYWVLLAQRYLSARGHPAAH